MPLSQAQSDLPPPAAQLGIETDTTRATSATRVFGVALAVVLGAGVAFRLYHYIANRTLWLDEAMLSLNLVTRSAGELLREPLELNQGAPLGFLLIERTAVALLGPGERALRLAPLVASVAALLLFPWMAAHFAASATRGAGRSILALPPTAAASVLTATLFLAVGNRPVYFASEVKQYAVDLLATVALLWAGYPLLRPPERAGAYILFAVLAALFVTVSHPSAFVAAAVGATGLVAAALARRWRHAGSIVLALAPAAVVFAALYWLSLRGLAANDALTGYWAHGFMPLPPWSDWGWFARSGKAFLINPLDASGIVPTLLLAAGVIGVVRRRALDALLLALPFAFTLTASAMHLYPFAERLALFLTPIVYLVWAEGIRCLVGLVPVPGARPVLWAAGTLLVTFQIANVTVQRVATPYAWREDFRPIRAHLIENLRAGDTVYCYRLACSVLRYYAESTPLPEFALVRGQYHGEWAPEALNELDSLAGRERVWVLVGRAILGDEARVLAHMDAIGTRRAEVFAHDMGIVLYDTAHGSETDQAPPGEAPP